MLAFVEKLVVWGNLIKVFPLCIRAALRGGHDSSSRAGKSRNVGTDLFIANLRGSRALGGDGF